MGVPRGSRGRKRQAAPKASLTVTVEIIRGGALADGGTFADRPAAKAKIRKAQKGDTIVVAVHQSDTKGQSHDSRTAFDNAKDAAAYVDGAKL